MAALEMKAVSNLLGTSLSYASAACCHGDADGRFLDLY
jgi:hypothetical protein